jgi:L-ascorbate metabolism protein UlaG (beta-lactamase superfamily)
MPLRSIKDSKNFNGKIFVNPVPTTLIQRGKGWATMREFMKGRKDREPFSTPGPFPVDIPAIHALSENELSVLWIGHSSLLFSIEGNVFLTDPIWARRVSPFSFTGPKRFFEAPLTFDQLPQLDGILLSHDHYDHLDSKAIKKLGKKGIPIYCPLGVGAILAKWGIVESLIREFDWWEEFTTDSGLQLISTPARHFSGRGIFNRNKTLWTSWVIKGKNYRLFYGGDSGYFPGFREIGEKFGPFDLSMLEIGAYHPNWGSIHMGPQNAIKAQMDLNSRYMLPIHWGLFNLALHGWTEPAEEIIPLAKSSEVSLCMPRPGDLITKDNFEQISYWWRNK